MGYKYIGGRYAHRVIYEQHFGSIPKGWVVHHKDEDKGNNDPSNLEAMPRKEHQRLHATGRANSDAQKAAAARTLESLRTPKQAKCIQCGSDFVSKSAGIVRKFCSRSCLESWRDNRFEPELRNCLVCEGEYLAKRRFQRYCCKQCNNKSTVRTYRTEATGRTPRRTLAELGDVQPDG
jgi:hypothetical protein